MRSGFWLLLLVGLVALTVYLLTLAPDITWAHDGGDGGDLITAVMTGGVPHPPGYPTYLLLASPLAHLPWGNAAWRMNFFSALAAAGAAGLVAWTIAELTTSTGHESRTTNLVAVGAALALAFSPVLWSQAVITEVYALGALFAALLMFLAMRLSSQGKQAGRMALFFGVALSTALGVHPPLILNGLLAPVALGRRWKSWAWAAVGFVIGLGVFLALRVRALNDAPVNWGNASTPEGFWWLISAQLYRGYVFALPLSSLGARLLAWASMTVRQFTPIGALGSVLGVWWLWREKTWLARTMLIMLVGFSVFAIGYNTTDSYVYLIPTFVILAIWLGVGLDKIIARLDMSGWRNLSGCVLLLPLAELLIGWPAANVSADRSAVDFGQTVMAQAPNHAILLTTEDAHTFTLWYYRYACGQRPDVMVVDRDMLSMPWYRDTIARESGLPSLESSSPEAALTTLGRPVCRVSSTKLECK